MSINISRRAVLGTSSAALATGVIAACGGSGAGSGGSVSAPQDTDITAEITYAHWDEAQDPALKQIIEKFNETYPNITVNTVITPFKDYWTKLQTQAQGNDMPDVLWMNGPNIKLYAENGKLLNLENLFGSDGLDKSNYPESLINLYTSEGAIYAVPKDFDTIGLWYNKDLFFKAGEPYPDETWTWDDFYAAAKRLNDALPDGVFGAILNFRSNQTCYYNAILQNGGFIIGEDGASAGYTEPETIEAINWLKQFADEGISPTVAQLTDTPGRDRFLAGGGALFWGGSWEAKPLMGSDTPEAFAATVLPEGSKRATVIHGLGNAIAANTKHPEAAAAFVAFLGSEEAARILADSGTVIPAFNGTQDAWVNAGKDMNLQVFLDMASEYSVPLPNSRNTSAWMDNEAEVIQQAIAGDLPVEDALKQIQDDVVAKLAAEKS